MYGTISYAGIAFSGDPFEATVTRLAVEALAGNDSRITAVSRLAAEVLAANDSIDASVTRVAVEVLGDAFGGLDEFSLEETRLVVEVLSGPTEFSTQRPHVGRLALEILAAADLGVDGLEFTSLAASFVTLSTVLHLADWTDGGQMALQTNNLVTIRLYGDNIGVTVRISDGTSHAEASFATPTDPFVLSVRAGATPAAATIRLDGVAQTISSSGASWSGFTVDRLNDIAPAEYPEAGQVAELMLFSRNLTDPELAYIESYLTCRWITPSCNVYTDLGPAP